MLMRLARSVREYKTDSILTLLFIVLEAIIETFIPFITSEMIDRIELNSPLTDILKLGGLLIIMAGLSLTCGGVAAKTCARASAGFAKNLRHDLFYKIQDYSFENIDKFSSTSLVTRMTTDVANVQMSYMMIIRTAVRAPPDAHLLHSDGLLHGRTSRHGLRGGGSRAGSWSLFCQP